ncbi:ABC transporter permease [Clostridium oceanicum]|uniref:ABC transporter permease n=1 Tax=Clostridium oceanicum TaxID=1543 RepID=A0ABN1JXJ3_9CLOT
MFENNNKSVVRRLSKRSIKSNKNYIAIIAIALSTILFTSMFTITGSLRATIKDSDMRKMGTSAHAGLKHLTGNEYKKVSKDENINKSSYSVIIGEAKGESFHKLPSEIRWAEDNYAKWTFNFPTKGKMPQRKNEIAMSTLVLDALGIPKKIGEKVKLTFKTDEKTVTNNFILSGIWKGDPVAFRQTIWFSKSYCSKVAPITRGKNSDNKFTGYVDSLIMFSSPWNIEKNINKIAFNNNIEESKIAINSSYGTAEIDPSNLIAFILGALIIIIAGYLLIYNIFYISIAEDIKSYGLLKTIGMTSKQIRKMVRFKALILSCIGIPIGIVLGWPLGRVLVPYIINILGEDMNVVTTINPFIFIFSAIFSLITVYLSCIKPASIASKVSPIDAVRYNNINKNTLDKKKTKTTHKVKPLSMALGNLKRNGKKVFIVVLSFSLSLVILNSTYCYVHSFDFDKFVAKTSISDFSVADRSIIKSSEPFNTNGVSNNFVNEVKTLKGLDKMGNIYMNASRQYCTNHAYNRFKKYIDSLDHKKKEEFMSSSMMVKKFSGVNVFGFDKWPSQYIKVIEGSLDFDSWEKGEGIYITTCHLIEDGKLSIYKPGDIVSVDFSNGKVKKYKVLAIVEYPEAFSSPQNFDLGLEYILPSKEFLSNEGKTKPMGTIFNVDNKYIDKTEKWIKNYCANKETSLDFWSKKTLQKQFKSLTVMYTAVGGSLCVILAIIGLLNFINSIVTSIITRRRELAMLQAVGMTDKQIKWMLIFEGSAYGVLGLILSIILGSIINITLIPALGSELYYFTLKSTLTPILLCIIPLIIITALVPILSYNRLSKNSIIEQLRTIE